MLVVAIYTPLPSVILNHQPEMFLLWQCGKPDWPPPTPGSAAAPGSTPTPSYERAAAKLQAQSPEVTNLAQLSCA
jgi:hypothetical protein